MKYRIIGFVLVMLVVGGLYLATEGLPSSGSPTTSDQPYVPPSSSDNEFKNLKIN